MVSPAPALTGATSPGSAPARSVRLGGSTYLYNNAGLNNLLPTSAPQGVLSLWFNTLDAVTQRLFFMRDTSGLDVIKVQLDGTGQIRTRFSVSSGRWIEFLSVLPVQRDSQWHSILMSWSLDQNTGTPLFYIPFYNGLTHPFTIAGSTWLNSSENTLSYQGKRFYIGGAPDPSTPFGPCVNGFIGQLAEIWFTPFQVAVHPALTPSGLARNMKIWKGGYIIANNPVTGKVYAGNPGYDGNAPVLPYPAASIRPTAPYGAPAIYLKGSRSTFMSNHGSVGAFRGFPEPASRFTIVNPAGLFAGTTEPLFGD